MSGSGLNPTEFSSAVTAISAAFGDPTRRTIYLYVREHDEGVTASEVAEQFALHANVARHHLDKLAAGGYLEVQVGGGAARTGAGRPSKRYLVSEGHDELEQGLLKYLTDNAPAEHLDKLIPKYRETTPTLPPPSPWAPVLIRSLWCPS